MFSIITPTFNRANSIERTIKSLKDQTFMDWEHLIIDDGSNDGTEHLVREFEKKDKRIKFFKRPLDRAKGANACRNIGIKNAKYKFLIFLDSDDWFPENFLSQRIDYINTNGSFDLLVTAKNKIIQELTKEVLAGSQEFFLKKFLEFKFPWKITEAMWRAETFREFYFDEQLQRFQDIDFHIRVLLKPDIQIDINSSLVNFNRDKDFLKYHDEVFIVKILNSYDYLNTKYFHFLTKENFKSFKKSNRIMIGSAIKLQEINRLKASKWYSEILNSSLYSIRTKLFLKTTFAINSNLIFIKKSLRKKIINKLLTKL